MSLTLSSQPYRTHSTQVALAGSLDSETAPQFEQYLDQMVDASVKTLVLDLKDLQFISSAGLRIVSKAQKSLGARQGEVLMTNLQPQVEKVFEIVKSLPSLSIFASVEEMDNYLASIQAKIVDENQG